MDKPWVEYAKQKRIRRIDAGSVATVAFLSVAWAVPRIEPAAPGVDGTIELERLEDVLHADRPIHAREDAMMGLLRLEGDQTHVSRVQVQVGKVAVSTIEVRSGLSESDHGGPVRHVGVGRQ